MCIIFWVNCLKKYLGGHILAVTSSSYHTSYLLPVNLPGKIIIRAGSMSLLDGDIRVEAKRKLLKEFALPVYSGRVFLSRTPVDFLTQKFSITNPK